MPAFTRAALLCLLLLLSGCAAGRSPAAPAAGTCPDIFVRHALDHVTTVSEQPVHLYDSNGAGVALGDLDGNGYADIVLANLSGPNAVLWNQGGLVFHKQTFAHGDSRAVAVVDVDGDGWLDVVFTRRRSAPTYWHNLGVAPDLAQTEVTSLALKPLEGVRAPAYAMAWADLNADGRLDLVTGSYDAELEKVLGNTFLLGGGAGIFYYQNEGSEFVSTRLAEQSQSLALAILDLNADGRPDILAGNDFGVPDAAWLNSANGWQATEPFSQTTHSTMSFALGDLSNSGRDDLLATDMKPYRDDPQTMSEWEMVMGTMPHEMMPGDPQQMENVLQTQEVPAKFSDVAQSWGIAATGWSWSSQFGDLDNDGFLDLYVVNGMAAVELFPQLPGNELVEENQAFRNQDGKRFAPAAAWKLNATEGGRGMAMADLDNDGDLDIVVNNLMAPAVIFENQLCGGSSLEVDLRWPGSQNSYGVGAALTLETDKGRFYRSVRVSSGYASGDSPRVHFGFPAGSRLSRLSVTWPDGATSTVNRLAPGTLLTVTRN